MANVCGKRLAEDWARKGLLRDNVNIRDWCKFRRGSAVAFEECHLHRNVSAQFDRHKIRQSPNSYTSPSNSNWRSDRGQRIACMKSLLRPIAEHQDFMKAMITYD
jgi:hypothetical protein